MTNVDNPKTPQESPGHRGRVFYAPIDGFSIQVGRSTGKRLPIGLAFVIIGQLQ